MNGRFGLLSLATALALALSLGAARVDASTTLGSADTSAAPDRFVCAVCPVGTSLGFVQFALRDAAVQAPEDGVLVAATVQAKRIAGGEPPRIAVLRPTEDGSASMTVVGSAPLPVSSALGSVHRVEGLHLPVQKGDSPGFLFRSGEVDLGVRTRPRPDGAIQSFALPCDPCGMDAGTGTELLLDAVVEPDVDQDGLGDESQDPDGGGLGLDWQDDWFDDFDEGDELDEDLDEGASRRKRRGIRILDATRRSGGASLLLRVPKAGRVSRRRHGAREPPHRRRAVPDDPDRRQTREARWPCAAPSGSDATWRPRPGAPPTGPHKGGRGVFPPPGAADAPDALGPPLTTDGAVAVRGAVPRGRATPTSAVR